MPTQLLRRHEAGVATDDDTLRIDYNRLANPEFPNACRHGVHHVVIYAWVVWAWLT
jgi:hypothetical protein